MVAEALAGHPELEAQRDETLLRAVVQVALDPPALGVGGGDDARLGGAGVDDLCGQLRIGLGVQEQPGPVGVRDPHAVDEVPRGHDEQHADRHERDRLQPGVDVPEEHVDAVSRASRTRRGARIRLGGRRIASERQGEPDDPERELAREVRDVLPGLRLGHAGGDRRPGAVALAGAGSGRPRARRAGRRRARAPDRPWPRGVQDADQDRDPEQRDEECRCPSTAPRRGSRTTSCRGRGSGAGRRRA